ncbi:MAG: hypothetical protein AAF747_07940 [Planctomycetota bacterium]
MKARIVSVVLVLAVAAAVLVWRAQARAALSDEVRAEAERLLERTCPDWSAHRSVYVGLIDRYHDECFEANFAGGLGSQRGLDDEAYWDDLFAKMIATARDDGHEQQSQWLQWTHETLELSPAG